MSAREKILQTITANKPVLVNLPEIDRQQVTNYLEPIAKFMSTLESIGGKVYELSNIGELESRINEEEGRGNLVVNTINALAGGKQGIEKLRSAAQLEPVYTTYISGTLGVAENGAVWIRESQMINRLLPFICQHLVIVLEKDKIVSTMQDAYATINCFEEGFGAFIAGPSKTADIEQALVIGAHGARSLTVFLVNSL